MLIYKITNILNNKCYIGQTSYILERRINLHLKEVKYKTNSPLYNSINKYGLENFKWEIITICNSKKELDEKEKYYIKFFNSKKPNGYNLTDGGEGNQGWIPTKEMRDKISKANKGKKAWNKGKKSPKTTGNKNGRYIDGRRSKKYKCIICGKENVKYNGYFHGNKKCRSCIGKERFKNPENNPMYGKKGILSPVYKGDEAVTRKKYYCIDCGNKICYRCYKVGSKRCRVCSKKYIAIKKLRNGKLF